LLSQDVIHYPSLKDIFESTVSMGCDDEDQKPSPRVAEALNSNHDVKSIQQNTPWEFHDRK
jgi:hypothetical protein